MTNETTHDEMTPEERAKLKKQLTDQAVKLAVNGRWQEAVQVNREYIRLFPNEAEGYNRLGKALSELGQVQDALDAYQKALDLDSTNLIAKRNIDRLAALRDRCPGLGLVLIEHSGTYQLATAPDLAELIEAFLGLDRPARLSAAALETLAQVAPGRRVAVLGDMLELGDYSLEGHREVGRAAAQVDLLVTVGTLARHARDAAVEAGLSPERALHCADRGEALERLAGLLRLGDTVLVKGSRAMRMEEIVSGLQAWAAGAGQAGEGARHERP